MEFRNRNDILRPARLIHIQAHIQLALCRWYVVGAITAYRHNLFSWRPKTEKCS